MWKCYFQLPVMRLIECCRHSGLTLLLQLVDQPGRSGYHNPAIALGTWLTRIHVFLQTATEREGSGHST